jgi:predicted RNA-binding protein with PIN domain
VRQILIDGHNVMFAWEGVRQAGLKDPRAGRQRVVEAASRYQAQRPGRKVVVVFDGRETPPWPSPNALGEGGVRVIYSRPPQNADMVIREMVEKASGKDEVWVVSSDREVQSHARACGAKVFGAKAFEAEMLGRSPTPALPRKGGDPSPHPLPQGEREKPTRMRKRDVDFWLKVMSEQRLDGPDKSGSPLSSD